MTARPDRSRDIRRRLGLRPIINVSGTMTALGASIVVPEAVRAVTEILPEFVEITDLQRKASAVIARLTGGEAGCVTASASAGITISVAGCMTGADLGRIEQLPDPAGMKDEVVVQAGHVVGYGAPVEQAVRLAGARVVPVGQATDVRDYQLQHRITDRTAAALDVVLPNPLDRLPLAVHPAAVGTTAWELTDALAAGNPPVIVRDHEVEHGHFFLDPCNLHEGEAAMVADQILEELARARAQRRGGMIGAAERGVRCFERLLRWPD